MYVCILYIIYNFCIHKQIIQNKHNVLFTTTSLCPKTDSDNSILLT